LVVGRDIEKLRVGQVRCWFAADWKWVMEASSMLLQNTLHRLPWGPK